MAEVENVFIGGDFNAHHEILGSRSTANATGRHLAALLGELDGVKLLNTEEPTHLQGNTLDLTFVSATLSDRAVWSLHPTLTSDHFASLTTLDIPLPRLENKAPKWCFKKANWPTFRQEMAGWWRHYIPPDNLDEFDKEFSHALTNAANAAIPRTRNQRPPTKNWWFYGPRVREANHLVNRLRKYFRRDRSDVNLQLLKEAVADAWEVAREEKEAKWLEWCEGFDQHTSLKQLWTCLRRATGGKPPRPAAHPNAKEEAERLVHAFVDRANCKQLPQDIQRRQKQLLPARKEQISRASQQEDDSDHLFTHAELMRAEKRGKDTSPGEDGATYTMLRRMGPAGKSAFLSLLNASWIEGRLPSRWKTAIIHPIPKPKDPGKMRPISLLSCTAKTAERMVLNRLKWKLGAPHQNVSGFTERRSTTDSIASLLATVNNQPAVVVFLDLEKAFELASPSAIADALAARGVKGRLLRWTYDYLSDRTARVRFQGQNSSLQVFENGTPQGGVLSPTLFNVLMEALVRLPTHRNVTLFSYADDLALIATGKGNRVARTQAALDTVTAACKELGLKVSAEKSKAMAVMAPTPNEDLSIQGVRLQWTVAYQYLGIWIDQRLTFRKEVTYLRERTKLRLNVMRAMTTTRAGATYKVLRMLYVQSIRSLVDYAAVALATVAETNMRSLETIQNDAMRQVLGAPRWTKLEALRAETRLPALRLRIEQLAATLVARTINSPTCTPARQHFTTALQQDSRVFTEKTWLRAIANATEHSLPNLDLVKRGKDTRTSNYTDPPPWAPAVAQFYILPLPSSKAKCTQEFLFTRAQETIANTSTAGARVYYTDGSVDQDTGKSAAAFVCGEENFGFRTTDRSSTLQTELVAISTALVHAKHHTDTDITLYTDSMSALQTIRNASPRDNIRLVTLILHQLTQLKDAGKTATLAWIPSHVGIPGNEAADSEAKKALSQAQVRINVLPSLQQIKGMARKTTAERARSLWRKAETTSASLSWYALATDREQLTLPPTVTRKDRVSVTRLRLGYPTVRSLGQDYEGELCSYCDDFVAEPLVHYLLDCEATTQLRILAARRGYTESGNRRASAAKLLRYVTDDIEKLLDILRRVVTPR